MARYAGTMQGFPEFSYPEGMKAQDKALEELEAISDNLPDGEVVGGILSFGVADGSAIYRVTKAKPLTVEHVPYCDNYQINGIMMRGLRLSDVKAMLHADKRLRKSLSKRSA